MCGKRCQKAVEFHASIVQGVLIFIFSQSFWHLLMVSMCCYLFELCFCLKLGLKHFYKQAADCLYIWFVCIKLKIYPQRFFMCPEQAKTTCFAGIQ